MLAEFPENVRPTPPFTLEQNTSLGELKVGLHRPVAVWATLEGRFDPVFVWRAKKRIRVGEGNGFGKKQRYGGRLIVREDDTRRSASPTATIGVQHCSRDTFRLRFPVRKSVGRSSKFGANFKLLDFRLSALFLRWWPGTESNRRRQPFQGCALPAELPGRCGNYKAQSTKSRSDSALRARQNHAFCKAASAPPSHFRLPRADYCRARPSSRSPGMRSHASATSPRVFQTGPANATPSTFSIDRA